MAETKYGDLVKQLSFRAGSGGGNARELVFVSGEEMAGFDFNFIIGVYDETGDWAPGRGAHVHSFDEVLLFFGYDDEDMNYLGSDMELAVGKELEKHTFSSPTFVAAPKGIPHCPLITQKVYKPFGHFHLALSAKYSGERAAQTATETDGNKYSHYFHKFPVKEGPGGADAVQQAYVSGADLEGLNIHFTMGLHNQTGEWEPGKGPHTHPYDEVLVFFGHKVEDLSYLGAELTIEIGPEREKHTFDTPTTVAIPRGLPHFPIVCNKLDRPYGSMRIGLGPKYESSPVD